MSKTEISRDQIATVESCLTVKRTFAFAHKLGDRELSLAFCPISTLINTLNVTPLTVEGYLVMARDVFKFGDWTQAQLIERSYNGGEHFEMVHLLRGEATQIFPPRFADTSNGVTYIKGEITDPGEHLALMGYREGQELYKDLLNHYDFLQYQPGSDLKLIFAEVLADSELE